MGNRLHFETKHIIEYSHEADFNWGKDEVGALLSKFEVQMFSDEDMEGCYSDNFYCPVEEIESMLNTLLKRKPSAKCINIHGTVYTNKEVTDFFASALANADTHDGYIYFSWF